MFFVGRLSEGPSWELAQKLSESKKTSHSTDIRDYAILLLLAVYGLRRSEVCRLSLENLDWKENQISSQISQQLRQYVQWRIEKGYSQESEAPFFVGKANRPLSWAALSYRFKITRDKVGIRRSDGARYQPRLHDFRYTFAVHRLLSWYQRIFTPVFSDQSL